MYSFKLKNSICNIFGQRHLEAEAWKGIAPSCGPPVVVVMNVRIARMNQRIESAVDPWWVV